MKKNPQSTVYTSLGVITKGTVLEVNVSELGLVTNTGKVVWGTYQSQLSPQRVFLAREWHLAVMLASRPTFVTVCMRT